MSDLHSTTLTNSSSPLHPNAKDLTGSVYGRLTVIKRLGGRYTKYLCICSCGTTKQVGGCELARGSTKSCGCWARESRSINNSTHGKSTSVEYKAWSSMWMRCTNPNYDNYLLYKDRTPPEEWRDFAVFYAHIGPKPNPEFSLDRIDNEKPYGPGNVRWATDVEQNNNRSNTRLVTFRGETQPISYWASKTGIKLATLHDRIGRYGWSAEKALTTPPREYRYTR